MTAGIPTLRSTDQTPALISLGAGLAVLALLWLGPLAALGRTTFSVHMLLHVGVVAVAAPLLGYAIAEQLPAPSTFPAALSLCLAAGLFEMLIIWGWHIPLIHDAAGSSAILFVVEQASFLAGGIVLWTAALGARTRHTAPAAAIALFLTFTHMSMFGLVLALAPRLLYDPNLCRAAFGLSSLDNQHLGGVIMIAGGLPYFLGTGLAIYRMVSSTEA